MKILQIIDNLATAGAQKLIIDTVPLYIEKGLKMDVLVLTDNDYPFTQLLENLNICKIHRLGNGSVYNPMHIFKIAKIMKDYDLVHVHLFPAQYWAAIASKLINKRPKLIFTEHSTSNRRIRNKKTRLIERHIYNLYDKIVCITSNVKSIVSKHTNISKDKLIVIENGVNLENINNSLPIKDVSSISDKIKKDDFLVMQVSSMQEPKDQKTLIKSLNYIPKNYKVILVGDGVLRNELENFTQENNLTERVVFLGKRNDVSNLLKTVNVLVLSSKYEGLSLSSIEGMASGRPFIASDVPGLTEIVKNYGILFPLGNSKKLADEILKLSNDNEYYNKTVANCQRRAKEFDINKMVDKHINLYKELLKSN